MRENCVCGTKMIDFELKIDHKAPHTRFSHTILTVL